MRPGSACSVTWPSAVARMRPTALPRPRSSTSACRLPTLVRALSGLLTPTAGTVTFNGRRIEQLSAEDLVPLGIAHVPQGRMVFGQLSVRDNLALGGYTRPAAEVRGDMERVLGYFPRLKERLGQRAGTLSGGEQQMLAIARGLLSQPRLLMLDEPSMGVAPILKDFIFETLQQIRQREQLTLLVVEQDADIALSIADEGYVIETGRIVLHGPAAELADNEDVRRAYLGG
ncbi:MAG: ABC transporter ATP-binding protein [Burkholderiales bacterium PBB5]|nr:MAG: ABC transporter ATP-binding protein [Burkholderiales bacterium PBB5]